MLIDDLVESCNQLMQNPVVVDEHAISTQAKVNTAKIIAIDRLQDEITMQHDDRDEIRLEDIERIINNSRANDEQNLKPNFDLNLLGGSGASLEWVKKSRKKTLKSVLSHYSKVDHMKFKRQITRSFTRKDGTCLLD